MPKKAESCSIAQSVSRCQVEKAVTEEKKQNLPKELLDNNSVLKIILGEKSLTDLFGLVRIVRQEASFLRRAGE